MAKKRTNEEFLQLVFDLRKYEYTFLEPYTTANNKIMVRHNFCKHEYKVRPADFLRGTKCPECFGSKKSNTDEFKKDVFNLVGDEYTVLGEYKSNKKKILMRHNICEHEYEVTPSNFKNGNRRCPNCFGAKKKDTRIFRLEVYDLEGFNYKVLGEYINSLTKIKMKHMECGHEYEVTPSDFLSGSRCPECFGIKKKTQEEFEQEVKNKYGDEYIVVGKYKTANTKIKIKHNNCNCGKTFEVRPISLLRGSKCIYCTDNISKGARKIRDYLNKNKIDYFPEYIFKDLKYKKHLRFDFAILHKKKVLGVIEYHGEQHYTDVFFENETLEERILKDELKLNYCNDKNIPILIIPYTETKNINKLTKNFIDEVFRQK